MPPAKGYEPATTQVICHECGDPYLTAKPELSKTCDDRCQKRRSRRRKEQGAAFTDWARDFSDTVALMEQAESQALESLPEVAREELARAIRPTIEKAVVAEDILASLAGLAKLLPKVHAALEANLDATKYARDAEGKFIYDADGEPAIEPDQTTRDKAIAHILKYTAGQPGLAPQPEQAALVPPTIVFTGIGPMPMAPVDADVVEVLAEVAAGTSRVCDSCGAPKPTDEFVGNSERCQACHAQVRERAMARLSAGPAPA